MLTRVELSFKILARTFLASAGRISRLGHEACDHAMKNDPVVEAFRDQLGNALGGIGGIVRVEAELGDFALSIVSVATAFDIPSA